MIILDNTPIMFYQNEVEERKDRKASEGAAGPALEQGDHNGPPPSDKELLEQIVQRPFHYENILRDPERGPALISEAIQVHYMIGRTGPSLTYLKNLQNRF